MVHKLINRKSAKGFTLVELLIVIVVIAILAAITIVAYSGITSRANASKTASNVESVQKVAESYNADLGSYPDTIAHFVSGSTSTQLPSGVTIVPAATTVNGSNGTNNFYYWVCGTSTTVQPTGASVLGGKIVFWDYANSALSGATGAASPIYVGAGSATLSTNCAKWYQAS